jgi:hypothetical protein
MNVGSTSSSSKNHWQYRKREGLSGGRVIALTGSGKDEIVYDAEFDEQ